ncbi:flagellar hook-length control protein FliK [Devosia sp.]|uniref:flagellar hook-length control protein FliK n=1 Tax=Devosia sp. TaxID=1871048 RepID=UPI0026031A84|nr:flagellar hook-length control protein FliK [Devosia sp.]
MAIPTQLPSPALAVRSAALQALVLQAGQVLEGKVLGAGPNGTTQVQIGKQVLNLTLPVLLAAGSTLNLQAQGSGAQQKLVLLPQPTSIPTAPLPTQASVVTVSQPSIPTPQQVPVPAPQSPPVPLPTRPSALQPLALQPGQRVDARVIGPAPNGMTQVQIGRQTVEVTLPTPLPPGATLPLQLEGSGAQQRLVLVPPPAQGNVPQAPANPAAPSPPPPANAGTTPAPQASGTTAPQPSANPVAQTTAPTSQPSAPLPPPSLPPPGTPQAALTQMVQSAVQRQDSIGNLTTVLAAVVGKVALPQPVLQAAQQVLAASLPLGPALDGAAMQRAIANSGIFQEAVLAQGAPQLAKGDLKTALLTLRSTLVTWLGQTAAPVVPPGPLPPPVRGALPRARSANTGPIDIPETPIEVGKVMLGRAEGSLARLRLHQHASLPETGTAGAPADWSTDIPVLIGTYQTVMQLQIHRDATGPEQSVAERGWQIHFAMDLPKLGEVGAQVGLRGGVTSVRLWATNGLTAARLEEALPELSQSLAAAGLRPGIIVVRADEPVPAPTATGHFVDSLT